MRVSIAAPEQPASAELETATEPQRERSKWITRRPWPRGRTRNAAPTNDEELVIDNQTFVAWRVYLRFRDLGIIHPMSRSTERVVKSGELSVRPLDAPVGTEYLMAYLRPSVQTVQIRSEARGNDLVYDLRLLDGSL